MLTFLQVMEENKTDVFFINMVEMSAFHKDSSFRSQYKRSFSSSFIHALEEWDMTTSKVGIFIAHGRISAKSRS